ncbi:MAG: hypothetical protein R2822_19885 [Spirosomataceae bacterium]
MAGESVTQGRIGITFEKTMGKHLIFARAFGTQRDFANYLAFQNAGAGTINRRFAGASLQYQFSQQFELLHYRFRIGIDIENQGDTRRRFDNLTGTRGKLTFDQLESFKIQRPTSPKNLLIKEQRCWSDFVLMPFGSRPAIIF